MCYITLLWHVSRFGQKFEYKSTYIKSWWAILKSGGKRPVELGIWGLSEKRKKKIKGNVDGKRWLMKSYLLIDSLRRRQCVNIVSTEPTSSVDLFGQKIKLLDVGQFEVDFLPRWCRHPRKLSFTIELTICTRKHQNLLMLPLTIYDSIHWPN